MARWLLMHQASDTFHQYALKIPASQPFVAMAIGLIMSMCSVTLIISMCVLYKRRQVGDKASSSSDGDGSPTERSNQGFFWKASKASTKRLIVKHGGREEEAGELEKEAQKQQQQGRLSPHVWQRGILMGERCQRPTFSGLVLYDEKGNPLPPRRLPPPQTSS